MNDAIKTPEDLAEVLRRAGLSFALRLDPTLDSIVAEFTDRYAQRAEPVRIFRVPLRNLNSFPQPYTVAQALAYAMQIVNRHAEKISLRLSQTLLDWQREQQDLRYQAHEDAAHMEDER